MWEDTCIKSQLDDAMKALEFLFKDENFSHKFDLNNVSCLGNCLGGLIAILLAAKSKKISNLILLNPLTNPVDNFSRWLSSKTLERGLTQPKTPLFDSPSKVLKKQFFEDLYNYDPAAEITQFHGNLLIFTSLSDEVVFPSLSYSKLLIKYHQSSSSSSKFSQFIPLDTNHTFRASETSLYIQKILSSTIDFLLAHRKSSSSSEKKSGVASFLRN